MSPNQYNLNDIAFKKFAPLKGGDKKAYENFFPEGNAPLPRGAYPLKPRAADVLRKESNADSVVLAGDVLLPTSPVRSRPDYWNLKPIYPGDRKFMDEMKAVVDFQTARLADRKIDKEIEATTDESEKEELRKKKTDPSTFYRWPKVMKDFSLEEIAAAVNGEYPVSIQQSFIEEVYKMHKMSTPDDREIIIDLGQCFRSSVDFIGLQVKMAALNTWSFEAVAAVNFMLKWTYGMPRPEEIAWYIARDEIADDLTTCEVSKAVVADIKNMNLKDRKHFTAYDSEKEDGSPTHPSFPAMHSAGSTCSLWLPALFNLTVEQYEQALLVDHAVAFGRTVAGVHYPQDNLAGLNVGQRIIREDFPALAARWYGYDAGKVRARVDALSFDWKCFDSKSLTIGDKTVKEFLEAANAKTGVVTRKL